MRTVVTTPWTPARVGRLRAIYHLADRRARLLAQGLLTPQVFADLRPGTYSASVEVTGFKRGVRGGVGVLVNTTVREWSNSAGEVPGT